MTTHTPGPWEAEAFSFGDTEGWRPWVGRLSESRYAALSCGETQAEAIANARLIAAAPELLKAALAAEALLTSMSYSHYIEPGALRELRDAIAKATGATNA